MTSQHRFGFAALVGAPNVGKSTLMNGVIGKKISIISRRPQTTRHRILGVKTTPHSQIVFVDTPGLHSDQRKSLNKVINRTALSSMTDVDLIVFMIDFKGWNSDLHTIFKHKVSRLAQSNNTPVILLINKTDRLKDKSRLLPLIDTSRELHKFEEIIPMSALNSDDIDHFVKTVSRHLPEGPRGFPDHQLTDRSERFLAAEFVREQVFGTLGQELPYSVAAEVTKFEPGENQIHNIDVVIWVEKPGQKAIVIGKNGEQLKNIGTKARKQMERSFEKKIFLTLWVKVKSGWADRAALLHSLGYSEI